MTKQELVTKMSEKIGVSKKQAEETLDALCEMISNTLSTGSEITLPGIGKLSVVGRAARIGRNPATGEELKIAAKKAVKFGVAKALKDAVNVPAKKGKK